MKTLRVNIHSFVDVITNSSTVIYVQCTNETTKLAKDLINTILKAANVKQTASDLFDFKIEPNECFKDSICYDLIEYKEHIQKIDKYKHVTDDEIEEKSETIAKDLLDAVSSKKIPEPDGWSENSDGWNQETLVITAKDNAKISIDLAVKIQQIFEIDGQREG